MPHIYSTFSTCMWGFVCWCECSNEMEYNLGTCDTDQDCEHNCSNYCADLHLKPSKRRRPPQPRGGRSQSRRIKGKGGVVDRVSWLRKK